FDQYGMVLNVQGKTGERRVRVIGDSIAYVAAWLEVHPAGKNRDSPLFTGVNEMSRKNVMSYAQSHKVLVSLKARSGLKKRIHPHLFRHTKMTERAAMRREVAKLQLEVARLSRQLTGPGTPSAPGASRASRGATPRGPR